MGRQGMYVREFPPQMDWQHISEGLSVFNLMGLSTPNDARLIERTRRFAGFYDGSDATAPNYDAKHRVIRSMFNGSLGPLLRPTTALDWAGDPFDASRFKLEHGERNFEEFLAHFAGVHRHGLRQPAQPAVHHAGAQCLSIDRRETLARLAAVVRRRLGGTRRRQRRHPAEQGRARWPHRGAARVANGTKASTAGPSVPSCRRPASARIAIACRVPSWPS